MSTNYIKSEALALIPIIEKAFVNIPRPRITLHVARGFDDEWHLSQQRGEEFASLDPETRSQDVTDDAIEDFQEYFSFSDDEGELFYLPAFMCHYLRKVPNPAYDAVYWACIEHERLQFLNTQQTECIKLFVDFCHKYQEDL